MFRLQHQFNNVVEATQLNNDQMPEFHCHCECSKCLPPVPSNNNNLQSPYLRNLLQPCRSVPDNLKRFLEFGACFQLCFKRAVSFQHCTPYGIRNLEAIVFCDDILTAGPQPVLCTGRRCALCVLTRRRAGR